MYLVKINFSLLLIVITSFQVCELKSMFGFAKQLCEKGNSAYFSNLYEEHWERVKRESEFRVEQLRREGRVDPSSIIEKRLPNRKNIEKIVK